MSQDNVQPDSEDRWGRLTRERDEAQAIALQLADAIYVYPFPDAELAKFEGVTDRVQKIRAALDAFEEWNRA